MSFEYANLFTFLMVLLNIDLRACYSRCQFGRTLSLQLSLGLSLGLYLEES